jgi:hypothetical protein
MPAISNIKESNIEDILKNQLLKIRLVEPAAVAERNATAREACVVLTKLYRPPIIFG